VRRVPALAAAVVLAVAGPIPAASAATGQVAIPQSQPLWATPTAKVGDAPTGQQLTFRVYLPMRDQNGAAATARAVSDPKSPSYHQYLSPDQVRSLYAPDQQTVATVRNWLSTAGFTLSNEPANNAYVEATGTVDQAQRAFGVHLGEYSVQGMTLRAADRELSVPSTVAPSVLGVIGVDQSTNLLRPDNQVDGSGAPSASTNATPGTVPPPAGFRNAPPCSQFFGQQIDTTDPAFNGTQLPYAPCGYVPSQLRSAYGIDGAVAHGIDGRGTTVAIVDAFASPNLQSDATQYAALNDPSHPLKKNQFRELLFPDNTALEGPDQCDAAGWYGEQTLDVEAVHAMAPGANILYVGGSDCQDVSLDKAVNAVVAGHLADMVSNSYGDLGEGLPADEIQAFQTIAMQSALEGIGLYFSSGDSGDESLNLPQPSPDFPASSPFVTAVGGTSLGVGADGRTVVQTGWETGRSVLSGSKWGKVSFTSGAGGGTSRLFAEPFYQQGVVPSQLAKKNQTGDQRGRVVPDVAMDADPTTGMLIGETQTFPEGAHYDQFRIGGTSLASPLLAGVMADSDQTAGFHHGFLNPALYEFGPATSAVTDIQHVDGGLVRVDFNNSVDSSQGTTTSVRVFDFQGLTIQTAPGYDNVTGLGVPNGTAFLTMP
jgi:subtilase family serine protease